MGRSQLLTHSNEEGAKSSKGAPLSFLRQRHNMKWKNSTVQRKTKYTPTQRQIMQPKKHKKQTQGPTGLYELFLLTVPIEEVARWQYIKQLW